MTLTGLFLLAPVFVPPQPVLPPYVAPLTVIDDVLHLPPGAPPTVADGAVCYGGPAHLRLAMALHLGESLSSERARVSWLMGWQSAAETGATALDEEQGRREAAESNIRDLEARLAESKSMRWGIFEVAGTSAGLFLVGALVGAGVYAWSEQ